MDVGLHQVFKSSPKGKVLLTLGEAGVPGDDASHFNLSTDIACHSDASVYISDGCRNTRIMKFTAAGKFDFQWGAPRQAQGASKLPHGIGIDSQGRVIVCDRENHRLQIFDASWVFVKAWTRPHITTSIATR